MGKAVEKFIEVVAQGIGILYEPTNIKRIAKARKEEIKTITEAIRESDLPISYNNGAVAIEASTKELIERTRKKSLYVETKKQKNIEDIIIGAYFNIETNSEVSEEELQGEWINRFFNIAGEISSDDLKLIWSKILSEEIRNPGNCSIRTLETLRNISRKEAEIFKKISNYIFKSGNIYYLPNEDSLLKDVNITDNEILQLDEAGLINSSIAINVSINFNEDEKEEIKYNTKKIFCTKDKKEKIKLSAFLLTEAGRNIFDILTPNFEEKYFEKYIEIIKKEMNISFS